MLALSEGVAYTLHMQYTIRGVPPALDEALRKRAHAEGKSLNAVAVAALADGLGLGDSDVVRRDLSDIAGTWISEAGVETAIAAQDEVDENLWR
jgi:hypothetical protein